MRTEGVIYSFGSAFVGFVILMALGWDTRVVIALLTYLGISTVCAWQSGYRDGREDARRAMIDEWERHG